LGYFFDLGFDLFADCGVKCRLSVLNVGNWRKMLILVKSGVKKIVFAADLYFLRTKLLFT
jgi:hypothetical protein